MERADTGLCGRHLEIDRLMGLRVDPERRFHRPAAIPRMCGEWPGLPTRYHLDESNRQQQAGFGQADIVSAAAGRLRQLSENQQFRHRRHGAGAPYVPIAADLFREFRRELNDETLVATDV